MGTNNLISQADGEVADAEDVQQVIDAMKGDNVPRASSGIPTDDAGSLGTTLLQWLTGYIRKLFFGTDMSMEQTGSTIFFKKSNVEIYRIGARNLTTDGTDPGVNGVVTSPLLSFFVSTSATYVDTGLSVIITTTGRPVNISVIGGSSATETSAGRLIATGNTYFAMLRGGTIITTAQMQSGNYAPTSISFTDVNAPAGTYTYKIQVASTTNGGLSNVKLMAYEI